MAETSPSSPEQQQQIYDELAALNRLSEVKKDEAGNIIAAGFSNHPSLAEENEPEGQHPGLSDADIEKLLLLPQLEIVALQSQKLTDAGYQKLGLLPRLEAVTISNPQYVPGLSHAYVMTLDQVNEQLEVLDLEQSQAIDASALPLLWGFPKLRFLGVDRVSADASIIDFAQGAPLIERLDLRDTSLSDEEFGQLIRNLPNLRMLQISVAPLEEGQVAGKDRLGPESLQHLVDHPKLEILLVEDPAFLPMTWETGLKYFAEMPALNQVFYLTRERDPEKGVTEEETAKLKEARPDMAISQSVIALPGIPGYDWRIGIL